MGENELRQRSNSPTETKEEINEDNSQLGLKIAFFQYMLKTYAEDVELKIKNSNSQKNDEILQSCKKSFTDYFIKWIRDINNGLTIFVYGMGSKHSLLQAFKSYTLKKTNYNVLIVNGHNYSECYYFELLKQLNNIYRVLDQNLFVDEIKMSSKKFIELMNEFFLKLNSLSNKDGLKKTLLIFNNINYIPTAPNETILNLLLERLLSEKSLFSLMATYNDYEFISTVSYYSILCSTQFVQYQVNTLENVWREIAATNFLEKNFDMELALGSRIDKENGRAEKIIDSVLCVYQSLTRNAQQIFDYVLRSALMSEMVDSAEHTFTILHSQLYEYCRRNFLTTNESSLSSQLVEFIDHNLIHVCHEDNGEKCYQLKFKKSILKKLIDNINDLPH